MQRQTIQTRGCGSFLWENINHTVMQSYLYFILFLFYFILFYYVILFFRATSMAYGSSQAESNRSCSCQPQSQQQGTLDQLSGARDWTLILLDTTWVHHHWIWTLKAVFCKTTSNFLVENLKLAIWLEESQGYNILLFICFLLSRNDSSPCWHLRSIEWAGDPGNLLAFYMFV